MVLTLERLLSIPNLNSTTETINKIVKWHNTVLTHVGKVEDLVNTPIASQNFRSVRHDTQVGGSLQVPLI